MALAAVSIAVEHDRYQVWIKMRGGQQVMVCCHGSPIGAAQSVDTARDLPQVEWAWVIDTQAKPQQGADR